MSPEPTAAPRRRSVHQREQAMVSIELLFIVPFMIVPLMLFALYAGRTGLMSLRVERAAREAARAASQQLDPGDAEGLARSTLLDYLGAEQWARCAAQPRTSINVSGVGPQPGGYADQGVVTVSLECAVDLSALTPLISARRTFVAVAVESVDEYRSRAPS